MITSTDVGSPEQTITVTPGGYRATFRAMASDIHVTIGQVAPSGAPVSPSEAVGIVAEIVDVFREVQRQCTRFEDSSDLMRANVAGERWCDVGTYCFAAIEEAFVSYERTEGLFDPRILGVLRELGYQYSWPAPTLSRDGGAQTQPWADPGAWRPDFDVLACRVRVGPAPIDLGGIGKGLAVRWAVQRVAGRATSLSIEAGGDCYLQGGRSAEAPWHVGIEDPFGTQRPVAVLALRDTACATSSARLRQWTSGGRRVHHLIDPRSGVPADAGLASVTVIAHDPARAEVWSKVLFVSGSDAINTVCESERLAAVWVDGAGAVGMSERAVRYVQWRSA